MAGRTTSSCITPAWAAGTDISATALRPRYSDLLSAEYCGDAGSTDFAVQVSDLLAIEAQPPVASTLALRHEPVKPVILPSLIVSASFPSVPLNTKVAPGLVAVSYETVRRWVNHFGPTIAARLRKRRPQPCTT